MEERKQNKRNKNTSKNVSRNTSTSMSKSIGKKPRKIASNSAWKFTSRALNSKCPISDRCGGCDYIDIEYKEQLALKQKYIKGLFKEFGKPEPIIGMKDPFFYRNKVHGVIHRTQKGEIYSGIYEEKTHNVLPVKACYIENEVAATIIKDTTELIKSFKMTIYNENSGYGVIRDLLVRTGYISGQIMLIIVTASPIMPSKNNFVKALLKQHPEITTVIQNINEKQTTMVLGERNNILYGKGYIEDDLCGLHFRISPSSFYQINPVQTEVLYKTAIGMAGKVLV